MRRILVLLAILAAGAAVLAPAIAYLGLDPVTGDFTLKLDKRNILVPATYSLCASLGLGLLYYVMKR